MGPAMRPRPACARALGRGGGYKLLTGKVAMGKCRLEAFGDGVVAIYWNNQHHMLHAVRQVCGAVLWANLRLHFWLSLIPLVTGWMSVGRQIMREAKTVTAWYGEAE
jgi:uncharacterized membrane protein